MSASTSSLAKLWLGAFGAGVAVIVALMGLSIATPPFHGDLSRIGLVSEREFGWRGESPVVAPALLRDTPIAEADVLVIGDSFSMAREWQSVLARDGLRVATTSWAQHGEALCADTGARLAEAGFRGRLVIVQSVERLLSERLRDSERCAHMPRPEALKKAPPVRPSTLPTVADEPNWEAPLTLGWRTWWVTRRVLRLDGDGRAAGETVVRAVADGCERFSHRRCRQALFYAHDTERPELTAGDVSRLRDVGRRLGLPVLWAVVPNKTTVYVDPGHSKAFADAFATSGLGPDLFAFARARHLEVRDFYLPNDTHLSTRGELLLGAELRAAARSRLAPP